MSDYNIWTVRSQLGEEQSAVRVHGSVWLSTSLAVTKQKTAGFSKFLVDIKHTKLTVLKFLIDLKYKKLPVLVNFKFFLP